MEIDPKRLPRKPKSATGERWGILNPYGDLWTYETFETVDAAREHVRRFWADFEGARHDLALFRPIRVTVRVSATAEAKADAMGLPGRQLALDGRRGEDG